MSAEGDVGTTRSVAVAEALLDARSERVVALLHRLTSAPEDGLRASVAAMTADERAHLAALADDILGDTPPTASA